MVTNESDILFAFPPAPASPSKFGNHLGVSYLRAALARDGMRSAQYRNESPWTVDAVAADMIRQGSRVIGFTVYDTNARLCLALAQSIKRQKPEIRTVFGGPSVTFNARSLMERNAEIDACVMGEAEETGARFFSKLLDDGLDDTQRGVAFRRDGEVFCTEPAPLVGGNKIGVPGALDSTPSPYLSGFLADGREGVLTARGCTHHCQYCAFATLGRNCLRLHSVERVLAELESIADHQKRKGVCYPFEVQDDTFTLLPARAKTLCQAIADRNLKLALSCITRGDALDEELIRLMREAGFFSIAFGLESAVPRVLRATGKVRPPDWPDENLAPEREFLRRMRESVRLAKKYGFKVGVSIILGLPTETAADGAETIRFVEELGVESYVHNYLWVFPGTPLWATHEKYGIKCSVDKTGLPITTSHSYNPKRLKPGLNCSLEKEARLITLLTRDALCGCDSLASEKGVSTAVVEAEELSAEVGEWLRGILNIGSVVVQVNPGERGKAKWLASDHDSHLLDEHLVPAKYYIRVQRSGKRNHGQCERWEVGNRKVDTYRTHKPRWLTICMSSDGSPLVDWAEGQKSKASVCDICNDLQQPEGLVSLKHQIEGKNTAISFRLMPAPPQVRYSGRWLWGEAPCLSLTRIEISACGQVRTCRQGQPIGKVGDSLSALKERSGDLARAAEQRRGCSKCGNRHCPRCSFPGMDDQTYCAIMMKQEQSLQSLDGIQVYSRLPLRVALQTTT